MEFSVKTGDLSKLKTACMTLCLYQGQKLEGQIAALDKACGQAISKVIKKKEFTGNKAEILTLHNVENAYAQRIVLVGVGKKNSFSPNLIGKCLAPAIKQIDSSPVLETCVVLPEVDGGDFHRMASEAVSTMESAAYRFDECKSDVTPNKRPLKRVNLYSASRQQTTAAKKALAQGKAIANGMALTKTLANLPGNICTPSYLASEARTLGRQSKKLKVSVLEEKQMEKLGMGALLSVSRGSRQPAKLIVMEYKGAAASQKPIALVGKGLTFDAGGISIKPSAAMDEMKYDMCGGATVFGAIRACIELELPVNVVGVVPSSENLPDGDANKPGDIVTSMSGQTIEVLNTDAEGRLILCDALTYTEKFKPAAVIDIATLTGACIVALGNQASGVMGNDQNLADKLLEAGTEVGDRGWQLPIWDEYQAQLDSNFADMANIGGRGAGTITAACFLSRFTKSFKWAHLDIAGTAWVSGKDKGATGRPVPMLMQYILKHCKAV